MSQLRMVLRMIRKSADAKIVDILEQEVPATPHAVTLYLRRVPFKETVADAMLKGHIIIIERGRAK